VIPKVSKTYKIFGVFNKLHVFAEELLLTCYGNIILYSAIGSGAGDVFCRRKGRVYRLGNLRYGGCVRAGVLFRTGTWCDSCGCDVDNCVCDRHFRK